MEWINVSGGLFVDAMIDDVHFKLLPIVQVHDATEYFFTWKLWAGCCIKTHTHIHTQSKTLRNFPQAGLSPPVWGNPAFWKENNHSICEADTVKGVGRAFVPRITRYPPQVPITVLKLFLPRLPTPEGCCLHIYSSLVLISCMSLWASCD